MVQFVIKHDPQGIFKFAPLQSDIGRSILKNYPATDQNMETIILVENNKLLEKSTAALHIAKHLKGYWRYLYVLKIVPKFLRDPIYTYIARNRYKWFGKKTECMMPTQELTERFLSKDKNSSKAENF